MTIIARADNYSKVYTYLYIIYLLIACVECRGAHREQRIQRTESRQHCNLFGKELFTKY